MNEKLEGSNEEMSLFPLLTSQEEVSSLGSKCLFEKNKSHITQNLTVPFQN